MKTRKKSFSKEEITAGENALVILGIVVVVITLIIWVL